MKTFDVYGIGNPIVDILAKVEDDLLEQLNLPKGIMSLVDQERSKQLLGSVRLIKNTIMPGGSCCNTMIGIANLGGKSAFTGVIGQDEYGEVFESKLSEFGVHSNLIKTKGDTGTSVILITPDSERTMNTHLGVCSLLEKKHIPVNNLLKSKIFHTTAYALDTFPEATIHAMELAREQGIQISFDLSDSFLVREKEHELRDVIRDYADIIFLNKEEARLFTGRKPIEALNILSKLADIIVLKLGSKGSIISDRGTIKKIIPFKVNAIDTTGAGDMYAAGFLYGITNGYSIKESGLIASFSAAKIVEVMGARLDYSIKDQIKDRFG